MSRGGQVPKSRNNGMMMKELELYAKDLNNLYEIEKKERSQLAEEKLVLELRVRELTSLNRLFQECLGIWAEMEVALEAAQHELELIETETPDPSLNEHLRRVRVKIKDVSVNFPSLRKQKFVKP